MTKYKNITTINEVRLKRNPENSQALRIPFSGWHFSYMGGLDKIITKLESYAHKEFNYDAFKSPDRIKKIIDSNEDLFNPDITNNLLKNELILPEYILKNKKSYAHFFLTNEE